MAWNIHAAQAFVINIVIFFKNRIKYIYLQQSLNPIWVLALRTRWYCWVTKNIITQCEMFCDSIIDNWYSCTTGPNFTRQISSQNSDFEYFLNKTRGVCDEILLFEMAYPNGASLHFLYNMMLGLLVSSLVTQNHPGTHFQTLVALLFDPSSCFPVVLQLPQQAVLLPSVLCILYLTLQTPAPVWLNTRWQNRLLTWICLLINTYLCRRRRKKPPNFALVQFCSVSIFDLSIWLWFFTLFKYAWGNTMDVWRDLYSIH